MIISYYDIAFSKPVGYCKPSSINGQPKILNYLGGNVIHYKVVGGGHDAMDFISEYMLLNFHEN